MSSDRIDTFQYTSYKLKILSIENAFSTANLSNFVLALPDLIWVSTSMSLLLDKMIKPFL